MRRQSCCSLLTPSKSLKLNRVALKTHHENLQSQAAMRKMGAIEEGTFRNHYVMPDGSLRHSVWFSIIREEWPQVRSRLEARVRGDLNRPLELAAGGVDVAATRTADVGGDAGGHDALLEGGYIGLRRFVEGHVGAGVPDDEVDLAAQCR